MQMVLIRGINLLKLTGYVMHQQVYNSRILHSTTLYLCILYLSQKNSEFCPI